MDKARCAKIILAWGLVLLWAGLVTIVVLASPQYQTVPTMPPPTSTPTATSTGGQQPTATRQAPTATSAQVTGVSPTQTTQATFTATAVIATLSPTSSPTATQPEVISMTPLVIGSQSATQFSTPTESQAPSGTGGSNIGLLGLIGGGVILVLALLAWAWIRMGKKQAD